MSDEPIRYDVTVERDVPQTLADGTVLRADIYRPVGLAGDLPVLLSRTPYDKTAPVNARIARDVAARGYVAVAQDIRGTHASEGEWVWLFSHAAQEAESRDGYEAVEWAARLPGSDGRVGTFNVSYMSWCAWRAAGLKPPSLKAMHVGGMAVSSLDMNFGIFETGRRLHWSYNMAADQRRRAGRRDGPLTLADGSAEWVEHLRSKWVWHLPLETIPEYVFGPLTQQIHDYFPHQADELDHFDRIHPELDIPVCQVGGWWDRVALCVRHYERLAAVGRPEVRDRHRLIIGPWSHHPFEMRRGIGPRDYGPEADYPFADQIADWYDHAFKGLRRRIGEGPPVHVFVCNDNAWRQFSAWPPAELKPVDFFLHSGGGANTGFGDGVLSTEPPGAEPPDHYVFDPADPFMSTMGHDAHYFPRDQKPTDHRADNLVFQTPPLEEDLLVIGNLRCLIWASSDALDTDFAVKLIEVGADGLGINLSQGIIRARYRNGYDAEELMEPGRPYLFEITMLPVGIRFRRGSRIRFDIASSDFPAFDRNHNTGRADYWADPELRPARQTIFHDAEHPSRIVLPVVSA